MEGESPSTYIHNSRGILGAENCFLSPDDEGTSCYPFLTYYTLQFSGKQEGKTERLAVFKPVQLKDFFLKVQNNA